MKKPLLILSLAALTAFSFEAYADLNMISRYVDAGVRLEFMKWPLPGYENDFSGWGVPHIYAKGRYKGFELTAGDFYEQFGSGFILRTYEERSLGIDNSIRGGRLRVTAIPGVRITALGGVQRRYWDWGTSCFINHMPAFAYTHTYALPALYPYATQAAPGEWAFQGNFSYNFKRHTALGGRYGTKVKLNFSYIRGLDHKYPLPVVGNSIIGTDGSSTSFFGMGEAYYHDVNLQIDKKWSASKLSTSQLATPSRN